MILICIILMTNDIEHFIKCLFAIICILWQSLAHVNWAVFHFIIEIWEFFIYSGYKSFIIYFFAHIFSQSVLVFNPLNIV